ncbi:MAG: GNAT family N-acetyltransferase [Xanthobacteraceae bacterium]
MTEAAHYSAIERLRDGRRLEVRALVPGDRDGILKAFNRASPQSLRRRFFAAKRELSEKEIEFFSKVDFVNHVALAAVVEEEGRPVIVGGGRYVLTKPGQAEIAFAVVDQYQGKGIGAILMRHLATIAREAGLKELVAEVLPENAPMLTVFKKSGLRMHAGGEARVVRVTLWLS